MGGCIAQMRLNRLLSFRTVTVNERIQDVYMLPYEFIMALPC
jgi:hypothetical protein